MNLELDKKIKNIQNSVDEYNNKLSKVYCRKRLVLKKELEENLLSQTLESLESDFDYDDYDVLVDKYHTKRKALDYHMSKVSPQIKNAESLEEAEQLVERLLQFYHFDRNDCKLDDHHWTIHQEDSKLFDVNDDVTYFVNSIRCRHRKDRQTLAFVENMVNCFKQYVPDSVLITWCKKYDEDRDTYWIIIVVQDA